MVKGTMSRDVPSSLAMSTHSPIFLTTHRRPSSSHVLHCSCREEISKWTGLRRNRGNPFREPRKLSLSALNVLLFPLLHPPQRMTTCRTIDGGSGCVSIHCLASTSLLKYYLEKSERPGSQVAKNQGPSGWASSCRWEQFYSGSVSAQTIPIFRTGCPS